MIGEGANQYPIQAQRSETVRGPFDFAGRHAGKVILIAFCLSSLILNKEQNIMICVTESLDKSQIKDFVSAHAAEINYDDFTKRKGVPNLWWLKFTMIKYAASIYPILFTSFVHFLCIGML